MAKPTSISKLYNTFVTMSDDTEAEYLIIARKLDDKLDIRLTHSSKNVVTGMIKEYDDNVVEAVIEWFTKDACNSDEDDNFSFTFEASNCVLTREEVPTTGDNYVNN